MVTARSSNLLGKITILLMVSFVVNTATALDGSGTQEDPWRIKSLDDFNDFAADANYWDEYTRLETDVNLAGKSYTTAVIAPDTNNTNWDFDGTTFTGAFDGNNFKIVALIITTGEENDYLGLFGSINVNSHIINLALEDVNIIGSGSSHSLGSLCGQNRGTISECNATGSVNGGYYLGGLCGYNDGGTISNCTVTSFVTGDAEIGGLCGQNVYGLISNCYVSGSVTCGGYYSGDIGGLCGWNINGIIINCTTTGSVIDNGYGIGWLGGLCGDNSNGIISNCTASGHVTGGYGSYSIGGLCGSNDNGKINDCTAKGSVDGGENSECIGGLCGYNFGEISNCYAASSVTGPNDSFYLGGLVGYNTYGTITNCYAAGSVMGGVGSGELGGLVGINRSTIIYCYSTVSVSGDQYVGGLIGSNYSGGTISDCYSMGSVGGNDFVGGLVGRNGYYYEPYCFTGSIISSYWNPQTSGETDMCGYQSDCSSGCDPNYGKTTVEMHQQSTFTDWDFINVWDIGENQTYPYLRFYLPSDINKDGIVNFLDLSITANQWMEGAE